MRKYVTKTGRAISDGRVTRASHLIRIRQRKQDKPLPTDLQCHPKRLAPTPRHPECYNYRTWQGLGMHLSQTWSRKDFLDGRGLQSTHKRYTLTTESESRCYGWTDDLHFAMAWQWAASILGVTAEVIDNHG